MKKKDSNKEDLENQLSALRQRVAQLEASELRLKLIEENLCKSEERFRTLAEFTYDWETWRGPDGRYIYVSPSCERITGRTQEEFMVDPDLLVSIAHPEDREKIKNHFEKSFRSTDMAHLDFRIVSRTGEVRWISHYCQGAYTEDGTWLGRRASNRDISQRKRTEEELRKVNRALNVLSESRRVMTRTTSEKELLNRLSEVIVHQGGYRLAWVGFAEHDEAKTVFPAAQAGFEDGYLERASISWGDNERGRGPTGTAIRTGQPCICRNIVSDPRFAPWREEAIKRGYSSSVALPIELAGETVGALNIYAAEADAFNPEEMKRLQELARDLAYGLGALRNRRERERAEEALRKTSEKVKMFAYSVSHDLKNPAIAVHGLARLLQKTTLDEKGRSYCEQILKAAEHIASLVEKINIYISAKEIPLNIESIQLKEMVQNVKDEFSFQLANRGIAWIEPGLLPELCADRLSIMRILRNLVDNALKYGGSNLSEIKIGCEDSAESLILSVEDNGVGVKEEDAGTIFRPFKRKKSAEGVEGTGLGLAIVKEIAERHGGEVWLEPSRDKGTIFCVSISKSLKHERLQPPLHVDRFKPFR
jgi:PAS domain S-box-containing protein